MRRGLALALLLATGGGIGCGGAARSGDDPARIALPVTGLVGDLPDPRVRFEIEVRRDGWVGAAGQGPLALDALRDRLRAAAAATPADPCGLPTLRPLVRADRDVRWDVVEGVLAACVDARCPRPAFAVDAIPEGAFAFELPRDACGPTNRTADWEVARAQSVVVGCFASEPPGLESAPVEAYVALPGARVGDAADAVAERLHRAWAASAPPDAVAARAGSDPPRRRMLVVELRPDASVQAVLALADAAVRAGADDVAWRRGAASVPTASDAALREHVARAGPPSALSILVTDAEGRLPAAGAVASLAPARRVAGPAGVRIEDGWVRPAFPARRFPSPGRRPAEPTIDWLVAHARPDGGWSASEPGRVCDGADVAAPTVDGQGSLDGDVAATALALLAFLGRGVTQRSDGAEGKVVAAGLRFLRNAQADDGPFRDRPLAGGAADQAIATLALVEAYGMTGSAILRRPVQRAVDALLRARRADGGWGAAPGSVAPDVRATSFSLRALATVAAIVRADGLAGKPPSLTLPDHLRGSVVRLVDDADAPVDLATRATLRLALGAPRRGDPWVERAWAEVPMTEPTADAVRADLERWWGWLGILRATRRPPPSEAWERALYHAIAALARTDGDVCGPRGSVDPDVACRGVGGRVAATAWAAMLEDGTGCSAYDTLPTWPEPAQAPAPVGGAADPEGR